MQRILLFLIISLLASQFYSLNAQNIWAESQASKTNLHSVELTTFPSNFRLLDFDANALTSALNSNTLSASCIDIPMPDGSEECFVLEEYNIISDGLKTQRADIKTYRGRSLYNPKARLHMVQTEDDIHLIGDSDEGTFFMDKVIQGTESFVISYFDKEVLRLPVQCSLEADPNKSTSESNLQKSSLTNLSWGTELRKFRMAIMFTSGHSANYGNDIAAIIDRELEIVVDMNFVCERDLCVTFELAANPEAIIYTDPATDPYNGLGSITGLINDAIGSENYEIGMAINGGGGGVSYLGVTCGGSKAGSQCSNDHWTIIHEMGHNMGAGHMFNYCPGWGSDGMEPGAGNSIMSYGSTGVCSDGHQVPGGRINYFHGRSVEQMYNVLFVNNDCAENIVTNNNPPVLTMPTGGFSIPISTPFVLTGSATDPDGTTDFLFSWEQFDYGIGSPPSAPTDVDPLFQMFPFSDSPSRTIPKIESIINGYTLGEVLPEVSRTLNFRLSARDDHPGGSGITFDDMQFLVDGNSGPFVVNYPNETTAVWAEGQTVTVTWDVANTNQSPVNSQLVDILLSTDGGYTYPITLATAVTNDGSQEVTTPNNIGTTNRVKVASADNIFFDISDNDFEIVAAGTEDFLAVANEDNKSICSETSLSYAIETFQVGSFTSTLDVSISGLPAAATSNAPLTVASNGVFTFTLSNLGGVSAGNYPMVLTLTETGGSLAKTLNLNFLKKENLITLSPDKAMNFDGSGQVRIQKNNGDFDFGDDKDFSVEFWTKTTTTSGDDAIISDKDWDSGGNVGWVIAMQSGGITFNAGTGSTRVDAGSNGVTINDGEWHHVAISFDRTNSENVQVFLDGNLLGEQSLIGLGDINSPYDLVIGADKDNGYRYEGQVDEVRLWKKALSATEIRENMHLVTESCDADLISCYQFNEASGNALDAFSMHHGTVFSSNRLTSSAPLGTGTSNSQVENNGAVSFINTSFDANYTSQAAANVTASKINLTPYGNTGIDASDLIFDSQYWVLNRYPSAGALTFDATFFVNENITAAEVGTPISLKLYGRNFNSDTDWTLLNYGSSANEANNSITFEEVTTYGQYLITKSQSPVIALYDNQLAFCNLANGGSSEVLSYEVSAAFLTGSLDIAAPAGFQISTQPSANFSSSLSLSPSGGEIGITTIYVRFEPNGAGDFNGEINHNSSGALVKSINVTGASIQPEAHNSVVFNGSNNIHIPKSNSNLDFGDDKNFSIEFWTKTTTTSGDDAIISDKDWGSGGYAGWVIAMQSGGFVFNAGSGGGVRVDIGSGGAIYNDGEWHHVAVSFSRTGNLLELYVDGFLKGSRDLNGVGNINTSLDLVIGADGVNGYAYNGEVEEVRIWGKALAVTEVREAMHLIYTGCETDLIASYHLDDTGATATDDVGTLPGTMNNVVSMVSSAPIGPGTSNTQTEAIGNVVFPNTDFAANYSLETSASITCSKLNVAPYGTTGIDPSDVVLNSQYWVLNDYENTGSLTFEATFKPAEDILLGLVEDVFKLYGRNSNSDTDWTLITDVGIANAATNEITFPGVQQYGQYLVAKNTTNLPLELLSFRGRKAEKSVLLDWRTTSEIDVAGFEIQRRTASGEFEKIAWQDAKGGLNFETDYAFEDLTVSLDKDNYYRLKIVDFSGSYEFSNIVYIKKEREEGTVLLYPNPVSNELYITTNLINPNLSLTLYDAIGKKILESSIQGNSRTIDLSAFPNGVYFYEISGNNFLQNGRVVVER